MRQVTVKMFTVIVLLTVFSATSAFPSHYFGSDQYESGGRYRRFFPIWRDLVNHIHHSKSSWGSLLSGKGDISLIGNVVNTSNSYVSGNSGINIENSNQSKE
ncbi:uncharacterized protein LOC142318132 [Lycorma delicatula]|uniref:uncharacterized protein LOC142318132 n=1 Tax=Lycorma delicatula TaxID=130591 RepID=UPI003F513DBF